MCEFLCDYYFIFFLCTRETSFDLAVLNIVNLPSLFDSIGITIKIFYDAPSKMIPKKSSSYIR